LIKKISIFLLIAIALSGCSSASKGSIVSKGVVKRNILSKPIYRPSSILEDRGSNNLLNVSSKEVSPEEEIKSKEHSPILTVDPLSISSTRKGWSWLYSPKSEAALLSKYQGFAFGDISKKDIYLTFDEGYENGYTPSILDTLKANGVKAAFFVTTPFATDSFNGLKNSELIKRMIGEGHIVSNHSVSHKSMSSFLKENDFDYELNENQRIVNQIPGVKMSKFFRPPMGDFSELSLYYTQRLGYKSIFFALAYLDYDINNQPNPEVAKANLLKNSRPGMICLLHAVSKTNAEILDSLIKAWKAEGYEFKSLDELP